MGANRVETYQSRIEELVLIVENLKKRSRNLSYLRIGAFVLGLGLIIYLFRVDSTTALIVSWFAIILFLFLIRIHVDVRSKLNHHVLLRDINQGEIDSIEGKWKDRYTGEEFVDQTHPYTYDLDIFGQASVFQNINRTCTSPGRIKLAHYFQDPSQTAEEIKSSQEAIQELGNKAPWNHNFQALGMAISESESDIEQIINWLDEEFYFIEHKWYPFILVALPVLFVIALIAWIISSLAFWQEAFPAVVVPGNVPFLLFLVNLLVTGMNSKRINRQHGLLGQKSSKIKKYASLLEQIEKEEFVAKLLQNEKAKLFQGNLSASKSIESLSKLSYQFDQRLNAIAGAILNGMMLWDLRCLSKLEKWRKQFKGELPKWIEVISIYDAHISLGRFFYNNPDYTIPEIDNQDFHMEAKGLGHPLLNPKTRVVNDLQIEKPGQFLIVTGANMAGKSTFLRTVGVNLILAGCGAPVCAESFSYSPVELMTSVHAADSLDDHESYFYHELKQLKKIIDRLQEKGTIFIIADEILRGTNSRDKQTGSRKFIEKLIQLQGVGMVATHDLSLGSLTEEYPGLAVNKRFEVEIKDDQLLFDYKLRDGISQNLNATFLMEKMGII